MRTRKDKGVRKCSQALRHARTQASNHERMRGLGICLIQESSKFLKNKLQEMFKTSKRNSLNLFSTETQQN